MARAGGDLPTERQGPEGHLRTVQGRLAAVVALGARSHCADETDAGDVGPLLRSLGKWPFGLPHPGIPSPSSVSPPKAPCLENGGHSVGRDPVWGRVPESAPPPVHQWRALALHEGPPHHRSEKGVGSPLREVTVCTARVLPGPKPVEDPGRLAHSGGALRPRCSAPSPAAHPAGTSSAYGPGSPLRCAQQWKWGVESKSIVNSRKGSYMC